MSTENISTDNTFWLNDVTVLYRENNHLNIVPTTNMTRIAQLNAMTRFCVYVVILFLLFDRPAEWLQFPFLFLLFIIILYNIQEIDEESKTKEYMRVLNRKYIDNDISSVNNLDDIDNFDDSLDSILNPNNKLDYDDYLKLKKITEKIPTKNNPFMNTLVSDLNKTQDNKQLMSIPLASNVDDSDINNNADQNENIDEKFNEDLYKDVEDLFDKKNSQRQFYTVANQQPEDQENFARWAYGFPKTCKEDTTRCTGF